MEIKINYGLSNLCAAIVLQAVRDYHDAVQELPEAVKNRRPQRASALRRTIAECRGFFKSPYCSMLCGDRYSGEDILRMADSGKLKGVTDVGMGIDFDLLR